MSAHRELDKLIWGGIAVAVIAPIVVLVFFRARLQYALDMGDSSITAKALQSGKLPATHNVTVTGGVVDTEHSVLWRLLVDGSERERYYLLPLRVAGAAKSEPVNIIVTAPTPPTNPAADIHGLLRNLGGEGPSQALKDKLQQQGVKVAKDAVLIELGGSSTSEALSLLGWLALSIFVPLMVAIPVWIAKRKAQWEEKAPERMAALKGSPVGLELDALKNEMFELGKRYAPADTSKSFMLRSTVHMGPLQACLDVDGAEQPAPPDAVDLFRRIYDAQKRAKSPVKMISYNFMWNERTSAWRMTGGPF